MSTERPYVLSIAGFDPSGGAGVLADIKTMEALQVQGMAVLTANTLQSVDQFFDLKWVSIQDVQHALETLLSIYPFRVIKIGIVPDSIFLLTILETIRKHQKDTYVIWDPVISSSSGFQFFEWKDCAVFPALLNKIQLLTPNQIEYNYFQKKGLLEHINTHQVAILRKGGHRKDNKGYDILYHQQQEILFPPRINTNATWDKHGSGCVLSSAIAAYVAKNYSIIEACRLAKVYVEQFLTSHHSLLGHHHVQ